MKAKQVVVQEAADIIRWPAGLYVSSLIPIIIVVASSGKGRPFSFILKGAETITFSAPASRCPRADPSFASGGVVGSMYLPVDSTTTLTPCSAQTMSFGLRLSRRIVTG